jgi:hypothetical protein
MSIFLFCFIVSYQRFSECTFDIPNAKIKQTNNLIGQSVSIKIKDCVLFISTKRKFICKRISYQRNTLHKMVKVKSWVQFYIKIVICCSAVFGQNPNFVVDFFTKYKQLQNSVVFTCKEFQSSNYSRTIKGVCLRIFAGLNIF